jgi:hypothetical protein
MECIGNGNERDQAWVKRSKERKLSVWSVVVTQK